MILHDEGILKHPKELRHSKDPEVFQTNGGLRTLLAAMRRTLQGTGASASPREDCKKFLNALIQLEGENWPKTLADFLSARRALAPFADTVTYLIEAFRASCTTACLNWGVQCENFAKAAEIVGLWERSDRSERSMSVEEK